MADVGMKISKETADVKSASDANLILSSEFNSLKIVATGTTTIPEASAGYPGTTQTSVIVSLEATGFTEALAIFAFVDEGGGYDPIPLIADVGGDDLNVAYQVWARSYVDSTVPKIKFFLNNNDSSAVGPLNVRYYAFVETAKTS